MKVYKFGGASVKDVKGIKNLAKILKEIKAKNGIVVVSAMGKMTNAFEEIVDTYYYKKKDLDQKIDFVKTFHQNILEELFPDKKNSIYTEIDQLFFQLVGFLTSNKSKDFNYIYDQIVSQAELLSTKILHTFLEKENIKSTWIDAKEYIFTDANFRQANVDFNKTEKQIKKLDKDQLYITQGFIASTIDNKTTTLGREGSDYSAAIFAYALNAGSVTIFKDVPGVLNADPKRIGNTVLIEQMSYKEAVEMAFYGASVIHPKTIKPLKSLEIPLYVKSFLNPKASGTIIKNNLELQPKIPCYIVKEKQHLVSITTKDFSFTNEKNISEIFNLLSKFQLKANLIQNTAISFSICLEDLKGNFDKFLQALKLNYKGKYNSNVKLLTVRHFNQEVIRQIESINKVLIKQTTRETVQFVVK